MLHYQNVINFTWLRRFHVISRTTKTTNQNRLSSSHNQKLAAKIENRFLKYWIQFWKATITNILNQGRQQDPFLHWWITTLTWKDTKRRYMQWFWPRNWPKSINKEVNMMTSKKTKLTKLLFNRTQKCSTSANWPMHFYKKLYKMRRGPSTQKLPAGSLVCCSWEAGQI